MRLLNPSELDLVSGGLNEKFIDRGLVKPTGPFNPSGGKAIGWCWGNGNLKFSDLDDPKHHGACGPLE